MRCLLHKQVENVENHILTTPLNMNLNFASFNFLCYFILCRRSRSLLAMLAIVKITLRRIFVVRTLAVYAMYMVVALFFATFAYAVQHSWCMMEEEKIF